MLKDHNKYFNNQQMLSRLKKSSPHSIDVRSFNNLKGFIISYKKNLITLIRLEINVLRISMIKYVDNEHKSKLETSKAITKSSFAAASYL